MPWKNCFAESQRAEDWSSAATLGCGARKSVGAVRAEVVSFADLVLALGAGWVKAVTTGRAVIKARSNHRATLGATKGEWLAQQEIDDDPDEVRHENSEEGP